YAGSVVRRARDDRGSPSRRRRACRLGPLESGMKRILAATDFSPLAAAAARRAAQLAAAAGARLALLHVVAHPPAFAWLHGASHASVHANAATRLRREAERLHTGHGIPVDEYLAKGTPHQQI